MKLWRRKSFYVVTVAVVLPTLYLLEENLRGHWSLARWKKAAIQSGEKFAIADLIPPPPPAEENSYREVSEAVAVLGSMPSISDRLPPFSKYAAPGKLVPMTKETQWRFESLRPSQPGVMNITWEQLGEEIEAIREPLRQLHAALQKPHYDGQLNYAAGFQLLLPHLASFRSRSQDVLAAIAYDLHRGALNDAVDNLEAMLFLGGCLQNERLLINQLVYIAMSTMAWSMTWQALEAASWTDEQLARLQRVWQRQTFLLPMARALEMERAMVASTYHQARQSPAHVIAMANGGFSVGGSASITNLEGVVDYVTGDFFPEAGLTLCSLIWLAAWSHQDELHAMRMIQVYLDAVRASADHKPEDLRRIWSDALDSKLSASRNKRFLLSSLLIGAYQKALQRALQAEAQRELVVTAIALKRFQFRHAAAPAQLEELVPEFLARAPIDYANGERLRYRKRADGSWLLYSVGADGRDDGGDPTPSPPATRYNYIWSGRDAIWPTAATPEEVKACWEKQRK